MATEINSASRIKYAIPCTNQTIKGNYLRISRYASGILVICGAALEIGRYFQMYPSWVCWLNRGVIISSGVYFLGSLIFKPLPPLIDRHLTNNKEVLLDPNEIKSLNINELIHELCEIDCNGDFHQCSNTRIHEIVLGLKKGNQLKALNTVPEYYLATHSRWNGSKFLYTPLQYWASKGNLEIVQLLVNHGATDFSQNGKDSYITTSALYMAAFNGHLSVVEYLLSNGAHAGIAFSGNLLCYFIPEFIFEITRSMEITRSIERGDSSINCLEKILTYLNAYQPDNLRLQFKIPISEGKNALAWIKALNQQTPFCNRLANLITRFGAKEHEVYSIDELKIKGKIGPGLTLYEFSRLK